MKPARTLQPLLYPHTWDQFSHGEWALAQIQNRLDEWLPKFFGYHLLKLGGLSCELKTANCSIQHQVSVDKYNKYRNVEADSENLPFQDKAFDVCVSANQLDYIQDPHRLLREIDRVLIDDGYVIISGFNPLSILGFGQYIPWKKERFPWSGRLFSPWRVRDWLGVLNYEVLDLACFGLFPATKIRNYNLYSESLFGGLLPVFGSLYFIVARKRAYPLNPIKNQWRSKKQLSPLGAHY